jgi:phosphate transport system permease protein
MRLSKDKLHNKSDKGKFVVDAVTKYIFQFCAIIAVISLGLIIGFVFYRGLRPFVTGKYSFISFITGTEWFPKSNKYGVLPMILASIYGTFGALVIGVPIGIFSAVFIAEIAPKSVAKIMSPAVQLLAGIPSVLFGVFGLAVIVPLIKNTINLAKGQSLLAMIIVLSIMMLPTIITVAETAIRAVPFSYREASLGLGASKIETIIKVMLPAAKNGILAAVVLGLGRALGETMAVILVVGNSAVIPMGITDSVRPLTTNIALEMSYAFGMHQDMLFATGIVLFSFIIILNVILSRITSKAGDK